MIEGLMPSAIFVVVIFILAFLAYLLLYLRSKFGMPMVNTDPDKTNKKEVVMLIVATIISTLIVALLLVFGVLGVEFSEDIIVPIMIYAAVLPAIIFASIRRCIAFREIFAIVVGFFELILIGLQLCCPSLSSHIVSAIAFIGVFLASWSIIEGCISLWTAKQCSHK